MSRQRDLSHQRGNSPPFPGCGINRDLGVPVLALSNKMLKKRKPKKRMSCLLGWICPRRKGKRQQVALKPIRSVSAVQRQCPRHPSSIPPGESVSPVRTHQQVARVPGPTGCCHYCHLLCVMGCAFLTEP